MKPRLVSILALLALLFAVSAAPASAQRPIPGIKQTVAFKQMKNYVEFLFSKRDTPVVVNRRQAYRTKLTKRRRNANRKVNALYRQKITRIKKQDDNQERRQVKRIRINQKRQIQGLKADLADRLADLQADQNAAVQRVYDRYAPGINRRADQRDRLKRQLSHTTRPTRRAKLIRKINKLQAQINGQVDDRNTDVNGVNARYAARTNSVNILYKARMDKVRSSAKRQIQQTRNAWRQTFRTQFRAAKTRRGAQKDLVGTVAARGFGYIQGMPPAGE